MDEPAEECGGAPGLPCQAEGPGAPRHEECRHRSAQGKGVWFP